MVAGQERRQAARRGAFQRADAQHAARRISQHGASRLLRDFKELIHIAEKQLPRGGKKQAALFTHEQLGSQRGLELLNPRGHIGLDAVQFARGRADSALVDDGLEYLQGGKIHISPIENESFTIIHLPGWLSQLNLAGLRRVVRRCPCHRKTS